MTNLFITYRHDVHPRKFLLLVEMLKAKHSSLWCLLSFSQQVKLLTLLEQMKPEKQDCILRVVKNQVRMSLDLFDYCMPTDNVDKLLSLLTRLHSTDRSHLLRQLKWMNQHEQGKLIRVMVCLKESEQVELLTILDDLELNVLKKNMLLNVMLSTGYYNGEPSRAT